MDIIAKRFWFLSASAALVIASFVAVLAFGLRPGVDIQGGAQWRIAFEDKTVSGAAVQGVLEMAGASEISVHETGDGSFVIRLPEVPEEMHQRYFTLLQGLGTVRELSFTSIGPMIGAELLRRSLWAILLALFSISVYVAWAFRKVSRPVRSWKYGLIALFTLLHDVSIPTGMLAVLGWLKGIEIDTNFIVALLVVMGFSVHDTIVVFDRVRENLLTKFQKDGDLKAVINHSIRETMVRSMNTSLTLVLVLVTLMLFGPESLSYFLLTLLVGTVVGTYSSIFVASPLLYIWRGK